MAGGPRRDSLRTDPGPRHHHRHHRHPTVYHHYVAILPTLTTSDACRCRRHRRLTPPPLPPSSSFHRRGTGNAFPEIERWKTCPVVLGARGKGLAKRQSDNDTYLRHTALLSIIRKLSSGLLGKINISSVTGFRFSRENASLKTTKTATVTVSNRNLKTYSIL